MRIGVQLPEVERDVRWPEYLALARAGRKEDAAAELVLVDVGGRARRARGGRQVVEGVRRQQDDQRVRVAGDVVGCRLEIAVSRHAERPIQRPVVRVLAFHGEPTA